MPKWKSPIFSDIRNAIGDNVVFSMWKGRPFFRAYVIPANPNTLAQQAVRLDNTALVERYQGLMADPDIKAAWNAQALPYLFSGYNLFVKYGRLSEISVAPNSGVTPLDVVLTYKCGIPLSKAGIVQWNGAAWSIIKDVGTLEAEGTVNVNGLTTGTYLFYIADLTVIDGEDVKPQAYQAVTKWKPDKDAGTLVECEVVVSAE